MNSRLHQPHDSGFIFNLASLSRRFFSILMSGICGVGFGMFISETQHLAHFQ
jgi:hypothetical protein